MKDARKASFPTREDVNFAFWAWDELALNEDKRVGFIHQRLGEEQLRGRWSVFQPNLLRGDLSEAAMYVVLNWHSLREHARRILGNQCIGIFDVRWGERSAAATYRPVDAYERSYHQLLTRIEVYRIRESRTRSQGHTVRQLL